MATRARTRGRPRAREVPGRCRPGHGIGPAAPADVARGGAEVHSAVQGAGSEARRSALQSWLCHLAAGRPWISQLVRPVFSSLQSDSSSPYLAGLP